MIMITNTITKVNEIFDNIGLFDIYITKDKEEI